MEQHQIKEISIVDYLASISVLPSKKRLNGNLTYKAVWRGGDNPRNVEVNPTQNLWHDHKTGEGGSIIDLYMIIHHVGVREAMKALSDLYDGGNIIPSPQVYDVPVDQDSAIRITKVMELWSYPLKHYLESRGISESIAQRYLKEIRFCFGDRQKEMYALGFPTIQEGVYILRNKGFKGCNKQDISVLNFTDKAVYYVFEGFMDFLSYVQLMEDRGKGVRGNVIVLNSVSNIPKAGHLFKSAKAVWLMLDNDEAGDKNTEYLIKIHGNKIRDARETYSGYKDLNEYLCSLKGLKA